MSSRAHWYVEKRSSETGNGFLRQGLRTALELIYPSRNKTCESLRESWDVLSVPEI